MKLVASVLCAAIVALVVQVLPQEARTRITAAETGAPGVATGSAAAVIAGAARVIDGDTLEIGGQRVRLEGIDAPEIKQTCDVGKATAWPAGRIAASTLKRWVEGRKVYCSGRGAGGYGRLLANCTAGGVDLNAAMIEHGLAWAFVKYSNRFIAAERDARQARRGIWAAGCVTPWDHRANSGRTVAEVAPNGCAIKGNITRNGRIYHTPSSPWYARTRVEAARGERWFCDERQAQLAGWRPAEVR